MRAVRYWKRWPRLVELSVHGGRGYGPDWRGLDHHGRVKPVLSRRWGRACPSSLNCLWLYNKGVMCGGLSVRGFIWCFWMVTAVRCYQHILWVCNSDCCGEFCLDVVMSYHIQYSSLLFLSQFCMIVSFLYYLKVFLLQNKIICHKENQSFVLCQSIRYFWMVCICHIHSGFIKRFCVLSNAVIQVNVMNFQIKVIEEICEIRGPREVTRKTWKGCGV